MFKIPPSGAVAAALLEGTAASGAHKALAGKHVSVCRELEALVRVLGRAARRGLEVWRRSPAD